MTLTRTLTAYIVRNFLITILGVFVFCAMLVFIVDLAELMRRAGNRPELGFETVATMAMFKLPGMAEQLLPFTILFGSMIAFNRLTRRNELVAARSSGVSVWQFTTPAALVALAIGILAITAYNPFASYTNGVYQRMEAIHLGRQQTTPMGTVGQRVWLRQATADLSSVIRAESSTDRGLELYDVTIYQFEQDNTFVAHVDAERASLESGRWRLSKVWVTLRNGERFFEETRFLETSLTRTQVMETLAAATAISFWDLPQFIEIAENAGLSASRYRVRFHRLLAQPAFFVSMLLVAATFTLRFARFGAVTRLIVGGLLIGFALFLVNHISSALGNSGTLPAFLSAWWPVALALIGSVTVLFYLEDG